MDIECLSGKVNVEAGTKFKDGETEWEVVAIDGLGADAEARCKPHGPVPPQWRQWERSDGTFSWCADSVASRLLESADGKPRSARGHLLTH